MRIQTKELEAVVELGNHRFLCHGTDEPWRLFIAGEVFRWNFAESGDGCWS